MFYSEKVEMSLLVIKLTPKKFNPDYSTPQFVLCICQNGADHVVVMKWNAELKHFYLDKKCLFYVSVFTHSPLLSFLPSHWSA